MRITLRQIAIFEAIARTGSIAAAAAEIGLSASAASMSLKEMETHLGVRLFERSRRRMLLSDEGRPMLEAAKEILVRVTDMEEGSLPEDMRGRLRIGAAAPVGNYVLPQMCAAFMHRHPGVRIELRVLPSQDAMEGVRNMALDIAFVGAPVNSSYLEAHPWLRDGLVVCASPDHARAGSHEQPLSTLAGDAWLLEKTQSSDRISFTVEALKSLNSLNIVLETDSVEAIKRAVRDGAGLACLSRFAIEEELARRELVALDVPELRFTRIFSMVTRRDTMHSSAVRAFREFAMAAVSGQSS